eukprot:2952684-Alexandrium_andersonii.AAC.1
MQWPLAAARLTMALASCVALLRPPSLLTTTMGRVAPERPPVRLSALGHRTCQRAVARLAR